MAEIAIPAGRGGRSRTQPRIDLTPMVDLGFLLITFFMLTTSMSAPRAMDIQMPYVAPGVAPSAFYESSAITLIPAQDHRVFYYEGIYTPGVLLKEARTQEALREVLMQKQQTLRRRTKPAERELQVLIKSHTTGTVDDMVALFDEMNILKVLYVAMVDIDPEEARAVAAQLKP